MVAMMSSGDSPGDDDGWTTVGRGKGSRSTQAKNPRINGADTTVTVKDLQRDFGRKLSVWKASSCRKTLLQTLEKNRPDDGWPLDKAVCLATGSFSTQNLELNKRSLLQLASFIDLVREMSNESGREIALFAQEPKHSQVDEEFLATLNITILDVALKKTADGHWVPAVLGLGPAKEHFGPSTLVCDFFMNMSLQAIREVFGVEPGLYIGTPFDQPYVDWEEDLKAARDRFEKTHVRKKMPVFEEDPKVLEGLMVYWPVEGDEDEDEGT